MEHDNVTLTERLNELIGKAEKRKLDVSTLEQWSPVGLLIGVGEMLGMTPEEALEPVTEL